MGHCPCSFFPAGLEPPPIFINDYLGTLQFCSALTAHACKNAGRPVRTSAPTFPIPHPSAPLKSQGHPLPAIIGGQRPQALPSRLRTLRIRSGFGASGLRTTGRTSGTGYPLGREGGRTRGSTLEQKF